MQVVNQQQTNRLQHFARLPSARNEVPFVRSRQHNVGLFQQLQKDRKGDTNRAFTGLGRSARWINKRRAFFELGRSFARCILTHKRDETLEKDNK